MEISNKSYYLYTGYYWCWVITPVSFLESDALVGIVGSDGSLYGNYAFDSGGVRPVINLKSNIEIISGDGTTTNPYVIQTS